MSFVVGLQRAFSARIETLPAAFEMDEILFELREHVAGLNCGRWDYAKANEAAFEKVRVDKLREVFDAKMRGKSQVDRTREDVHVTPADLLAIPEGTRTEGGLRQNIRVGSATSKRG